MDTEVKTIDPLNETRLLEELETFGEYISKYKKVYQQITSMEYQLNLLKNNRGNSQTVHFNRQVQRLNEILSSRVHEMESVILVLSHTLAWFVREKDRNLISDAIFSNQTIADIADQHQISEQCVNNLIEEYNQISIPKELIKEYGKILKK